MNFILLIVYIYLVFLYMTDKSVDKYNKLNCVLVTSMILLYLVSIYNDIVILKTCQEFSHSQPTNAILLLICELLFLFGLFLIEINISENTNKPDVCTKICISTIVLTCEWVPRSFAYIEAYNHITNEENYENRNYDVLKFNLIVSTILHSASVLFNFIITGVIVYYNRKTSDQVFISNP